MKTYLIFFLSIVFIANACSAQQELEDGQVYMANPKEPSSETCGVAHLQVIMPKVKFRKLDGISEMDLKYSQLDLPLTEKDLRDLNYFKDEASTGGCIFYFENYGNKLDRGFMLIDAGEIVSRIILNQLK